jgi:hypothetical protein
VQVAAKRSGGALGLVLTSIFGSKISVRTIALLVVVMALSMGVFELAIARNLRPHVLDKWFLGLAGAASVGFALALLALGFHWIKLDPGSHPDIAVDSIAPRGLYGHLQAQFP